MTPEELTARRERYKLRQQDLAARLGVNMMTLSRYERGVQPVPIWLDSWFKGEFGEPVSPLWNVAICDWWGRQYQNLPGAFPSPQEAYRYGCTKAGGSHWSVALHANTVIIVEK